MLDIRDHSLEKDQMLSHHYSVSWDHIDSGSVSGVWKENAETEHEDGSVYYVMYETW